MPDFTMCQNGEQKNCNKYKICYRYFAKPNPLYQSYTNFIDICNEEDEYHFFIKIKPKDKIREEKIIEKNEKRC